MRDIDLRSLLEENKKILGGEIYGDAFRVLRARCGINTRNVFGLGHVIEPGFDTYELIVDGSVVYVLEFDNIEGNVSIEKVPVNEYLKTSPSRIRRKIEMISRQIDKIFPNRE